MCLNRDQGGTPQRRCASLDLVLGPLPHAHKTSYRKSLTKVALQRQSNLYGTEIVFSRLKATNCTKGGTSRTASACCRDIRPGRVLLTVLYSSFKAREASVRSVLLRGNLSTDITKNKCEVAGFGEPP